MCHGRPRRVSGNSQGEYHRDSGRQLGFSFRSDPGVSTEGGYAEIGTERNRVFI